MTERIAITPRELMWPPDEPSADAGAAPEDTILFCWEGTGPMPAAFPLNVAEGIRAANLREFDPRLRAPLVVRWLDEDEFLVPVGHGVSMTVRAGMSAIAALLRMAGETAAIAIIDPAILSS